MKQVPVLTPQLSILKAVLVFLMKYVTYVAIYINRLSFIIKKNIQTLTLYDPSLLILLLNSFSSVALIFTIKVLLKLMHNKYTAKPNESIDKMTCSHTQWYYIQCILQMDHLC